MFFYSDSTSGGQSTVNVWKMNGTKGYLRHYENYLFLSFVMNNPLASRVERAQATKELAICEKKLAFWRRHPLYVHEDAMKGVNDLKQNWQVAA
ncbi:MAG: hypothetical protein DI537_14065 [Stutzerimonas stutzeri]|nr:MAG: hypothetical protein DI537_14065 [Stutzerimonas stutzeri]